MAAMMAARPGQSLPKQFPEWGDLKAAYRLLSEPEVTSRALIAPHCAMTWKACMGEGVVLAVQDDTHLAGKCKREAHTTLAVTPSGRCLGVLNLRCFARPKPAPDETRAQREERWRESLVWSDAVREIGSGPVGTRLIHVADRAADTFELFEACEEVGVGVVVRADHDRRVQEGSMKLWAFLAAQPAAGRRQIQVGQQRNARGQIVRSGRLATVTLRFSAVTLEPPWNHPGRQHGPARMWAVYAREEQAPTEPECEPIDWLLLTSEPVESLATAERIMGYYERRWLIEEWHRAWKEGCGVEEAKLDEPEDHLRRAMILAVIAVRLLQIRDLADPQQRLTNDAAALAAHVPLLWRQVAAKLAKAELATLTPRLFLLTIAKLGGYLGRKNDPRPGWKVLWRGWYDLQLIVHGVELTTASKPFG